MVAFSEATRFPSPDPTLEVLSRIRQVLTGVRDESGELERAAAKVLQFVVRGGPSWKKIQWRVLAVLASLAQIVVCNDDDEIVQKTLRKCISLNFETLLIMSCSKTPLTHSEVNSDANVGVIERAVRKIEVSWKNELS